MKDWHDFQIKGIFFNWLVYTFQLLIIAYSHYSLSWFLCQVDAYVVARHPNYISSYAPGHALSVMDTQQAAEIEFFDGQKGLVPRAEIYRMPQDKYNHDVLHIQQRLRDMVGLSVVSRDDKTGQYVPGNVYK